MQKRLFLLDAYALIFRAYYALIKMPRITSAGFNTSAIFGFVNTLEEILGKEKPSHLAVCFDPPGPTFRKEMFESYKGERESTPEDIVQSVPIIKDIVRAYNIPIIEVAGYEADDVIGTMSRMAEKEGYTVYMMTPDKDFGQLVTDNVLQFKPAYRGQDFELRGVREVCERYRLSRPSQVIDLLALMGDKVDSIPGCPGIGEKTAVELIEKFGSVANLLANTDKLKGAQKKKVEENRGQIELSYDLATIRTDVPLSITPDELEVKAPDTERLYEEFRRLEFRTLQQRVEKRLKAATRPVAPPPSLQGTLFDFGDEPEETAESRDADASAADYAVADNGATIAAMMRHVTESRRCGLSIVGMGDSDVGARIYGVGVSTAEEKGWYVPAGNAEGMAAIGDIAADKDIEKVTVQAKRDYVLLRGLKQGAATLRGYYDIGLCHYLLQPDMRHDLITLADSYLHLRLKSYDDIAGKGARQLTPDRLPQRALADWACQQADMALRLKAPLQKELREAGMESLLTDLELPLAAVLAEMEIAGVRVDSAALDAAAADLADKLADLEKKIHLLAGEEFNISSPMKVGEILFDKLKLSEKAKKTKGGQYSTGEEILEKLTAKHPIVSKILEYRQLKKLLNTYLLSLPGYINPETGKIHTNYNQSVTATGRLSSSNPNLQNIPVRDEVGRDIRKAFIADEGHLFLSADYSQIELRLVADFANEETMIDGFARGEDIHAITAARIYHKDVADVTADERRHAKTANFGILYGITAFGLAARLNMPRGEAKELIDNYFASFPKLKKYISDSVEEVREKQYAETAMGRRRHLPDINSKNPVVRGYAERNAINAPIQGTAADIIKRAMVDIDREIRARGLKSRMIMQVHDELNFDVPKEEIAEMQELVTTMMQKAYSGRVALTASCGVATNWLDAH